MKTRLLALALPLFLMSTGLVLAQNVKAGDLQVEHPWARATVTGQSTGGGFFKLSNHGKDDKLLAIRTDISATAEMHSMVMDNNVMQMRQVDVLPLPAGKSVEFTPSGYHVMFLKLKAPLKAGTTFPATFVFEKAGEVKVDFKVEPLNYIPPASPHDAMTDIPAAGHAH